MSTRCSKSNEMRAIACERKKNRNNSADIGCRSSHVSEAATVNLPSMDNMRRAIRSQRPRNVMPNPPERAEIPVLPQEYQTTASGEQFPKYDSGVGDEDRINLSSYVCGNPTYNWRGVTGRNNV